MILRQPLPIPFGEAPAKAPPHLRLAIGVSIALHVGVVAYVAYAKFNPPPVVELPQGPVYDVPLVKLDKAKPPPPQPPKPTIQPHQTSTFIDPPPLPPLPAEPTIHNPPVDPGPPPTGFDPPRPPEPPPRDPVIHDPRWISQPGADEFARFYPERAQRLGKEGEAVLRCQVAANGKLHDCTVSGETPENLGFGQAAIQLARYMRIAPKTIDGQPVDGGVLVEPIKFRLK